MVLSVLQVADAGYAEHLIVFFPAAVHQIPVRQYFFTFQTSADICRIDEFHESLPVILCHILFPVIGKCLQIGKALSFGVMILVLRVCPVADRLVRIQVHVVYTAVICGHRRDHLILLGSPSLLPQEFLLKSEPLLHLLLLYAGSGLGRLLLQPELCIPSALQDDIAEHQNQGRHRGNRLQNASPDESCGNAAYLFREDALPDEIGQHPVGVLHLHKAQRFIDPLVVEGNLAPFAVLECLQKAFKGVALIIFCLFHGIQKVILRRQASQDRIA